MSLCLPANNILLMFICFLTLLWKMEIAPLSFQERELCSYEKQNCRLNDKNNFQTQIRQNILICQCLVDQLTCLSHELGQIIWLLITGKSCYLFNFIQWFFLIITFYVAFPRQHWEWGPRLRMEKWTLWPIV